MNGTLLLFAAAAVFALGYFFYSRFLERILGIDGKRATPAAKANDGKDYVPAPAPVLFGHHFATIAGAGPIVGTVMAMHFGYGAVALWIVLGSIFVGAFHDSVSLFLSVRHGGKSIGSVIGGLLGQRGKTLFLVFYLSALVLVIAEFVRQVAATFVLVPAIATASLLFVLEAVMFGLAVYRGGMKLLHATLLFVPVVFLSVRLGLLLPLDLTSMLSVSPDGAKALWTVALLGYCFLASVTPVWILLQPRDYLNSYLLYAMMALAFAGIAAARPALDYEAFRGLAALGKGGEIQNLFPFLFVTVACGACSGFHSLVASGTTSKQLSSERHIMPVAFGGMLLEGLLAVVALIGVAGAFKGSAEFIGALDCGEPVQIFARSIGSFCAKLGLPVELAQNFILLCVAAFLMTSVDSATRLARFTWQELVLPGEGALPPGKLRLAAGNMLAGSLLPVALAAMLLLLSPSTAKSLWTTFAGANQLLAALTLLAASVWFVLNKKPCIIALLPMCVMLSASSCALVRLFVSSVKGGDTPKTFALAFLLATAIAFLFFAASKLLALKVGKGKGSLR